MTAIGKPENESKSNLNKSAMGCNRPNHIGVSRLKNPVGSDCKSNLWLVNRYFAECCKMYFNVIENSSAQRYYISLMKNDWFAVELYLRMFALIIPLNSLC